MSTSSTKTLIGNVSLSLVVKGVSLVVALFTTPAYISYFGNDEILGFWFTLLTVLTWILNCDIGVGNGLRNKLTEAIVHDEREDARRYISSSYVFLLAISMITLVFLWVLSQFVDWNLVFNVSDSDVPKSEMTFAISIVIVAVGAQLVLRLVTSVLYSLQQAFVPGLINLLTNLLLLAYCVVAVASGYPHGIVSMSIAYCVAVNIPLLVATFVVFFAVIPDLRPSLSLFSMKYAAGILSLGMKFLWLQMMGVVLNSTSSYLISIFVNNTAVVEYQIYYKIFILASTIVLLCTQPVWSAATKAQAEGDYSWLYSVFKKYILIGVAIACFQLALCFPTQFIFDIWLGSGVIVSQTLNSLLFALYGSIMAWSYIVAAFANGLNELKLQTIFLTIGAVITLPLGYALVQVSGSYLGIVIASTIACVPYVVVQTIWLIRYFKRNT